MKTQSSIYYRARLIAAEEGLTVTFEKWKSFHESECFAWCCLENMHQSAMIISKNSKSPVKDIKSSLKVKRIDKKNSRFAQETRELALANLRYRKRCQAKHLKREMEFAEAFLSKEDDQLGDTELGWNDSKLVNGTFDLVHSHYVFD
tara:strand:+ start:1198 stop:1638 length:441 start_codon:yes stop_codon:yes gene_type:complete